MSLKALSAGNDLIQESERKKILVAIIDRKLNFNVELLSKKANKKIREILSCVDLSEQIHKVLVLLSFTSLDVSLLKCAVPRQICKNELPNLLCRFIENQNCSPEESGWLKL